MVAVGGSVTACPFLSQTHRCLGGIDKATACSRMQGTILKAAQPVPPLIPQQLGEALCQTEVKVVALGVSPGPGLAIQAEVHIFVPLFPGIKACMFALVALYAKSRTPHRPSHSLGLRDGQVLC